MKTKANKRDAVNEICRRSYIDYCIRSHRGHWRPARHLRLICDSLQAVAEGKLHRLMIFLPPRHGKSMTVTATFPSYILGRFPDQRVIVSSYSSDLAHDFGRLNRQKMEEFGKEIFGIDLSKEKNSQAQWEIKGRRGGMVAVGIGGSITGKGADKLIIDDPIKNQQEANSITYRNRVWHEWQSTLSTRLHPGAAVIVILTRWHEDDLAGRLLNKDYCDPEDWKIIKLPAICEDNNDPLERKIGDPLWEEHGFDLQWAERTRKRVGSSVWNALYQQRPSPEEGSIFNRSWWKFYRQIPNYFDEIIQSWDCAFKETDHSDFVVGQVWGRLGANKYLLDQVRDRMDFPTTIQAIRSLSSKWKNSHAKLVEDKANGSAVIDTLKNQIPGLIAVNPQGGKITRAQAVAPDIEAGNVFLPDPSVSPWIHDFVEECASFPKAGHDDQVDAMTQALRRFQSSAGSWTDIKNINDSYIFNSIIGNMNNW